MGANATDEGLHTVRLAMVSALVDGDLRLAERLAGRLLDDGYTFEAIVEGVLAPVQHELGKRWAAGEAGIADEHAASLGLAELIASLSAVAEEPAGPTVVVAASEHDAHALGARVVAATLTLDGFRSVFVGAALPPADLAEYLEVQEPFALALSCSISTALAGAAMSTAVAHERSIPVVAGGRALPAAARALRLGADAVAASGRDAANVLHGWVEAPPESLRVAPEPILEQPSLRRRSAALVAAAIEPAVDLTERADHLAEEMARLLLVVESALLVDEPALVVEHIEWLRAAGPTHGVALAAIDVAVPALARALDGDLVRLGALLRSTLPPQ
jgi:methanogenic corrinoid protein MtbC1